MPGGTVHAAHHGRVRNHFSRAGPRARPRTPIMHTGNDRAPPQYSPPSSLVCSVALPSMSLPAAPPTVDAFPGRPLPEPEPEQDPAQEPVADEDSEGPTMAYDGLMEKGESESEPDPETEELLRQYEAELDEEPEDEEPEDEEGAALQRTDSASLVAQAEQLIKVSSKRLAQLQEMAVEALMEALPTPPGLDEEGQQHQQVHPPPFPNQSGPALLSLDAVSHSMLAFSCAGEREGGGRGAEAGRGRGGRQQVGAAAAANGVAQDARARGRRAARPPTLQGGAGATGARAVAAAQDDELTT